MSAFIFFPEEEARGKPVCCLSWLGRKDSLTTLAGSSALVALVNLMKEERQTSKTCLILKNAPVIINNIIGLISSFATLGCGYTV